MSDTVTKILVPVAATLIGAVLIGGVALVSNTLSNKVDKDVHHEVHYSDDRSRILADKRLDLLESQHAATERENRKFKHNNVEQFGKIMAAIKDKL